MDERSAGADDPQRVFCRQLYPALVRALAVYCGRVDVAEELAQEALARACARWGHVQGLDRPQAWVYRVGYNLARSWFRRRAAERRAYARNGAAPHVHVDADAGEAVAVREAVAALPARQRAAVALRYYTDLPIVEVAGLMGCAPGTVQSLTAKALVRLRDELAHDDLDAVSWEGTDAN